MPDSRTVVASFFERLNAGDLGGAEALMADDSIHHMWGIGAGDQIGRANWRRVEDSFRESFPDRSFKLHQVVTEGDRVAVRLTWTGTNRGEYAGIAPTGKPVEVNGMSVFRLLDGEIMEEWVEQDILGLYKQIGAIPGPWSNWPN